MPSPAAGVPRQPRRQAQRLADGGPGGARQERAGLPRSPAGHSLPAPRPGRASRGRRSVAWPVTGCFGSPQVPRTSRRAWAQPGLQRSMETRTAAVIPSPHLSSRKPPHVFCMLFPAWRMHYLNSPSAASPVQIPLSLLFLELSGNCVNAVRRHVTAVGILVRSGEDGTTSDNRRSGWRFSCPALRREPCPNRTICARRSGRSHLHVGLAMASVPCGWDLPGPLPATRPPVRMLMIGS